MNNQKVDTELLLSLELTKTEREKSLDLGVGYDALFEEWEVIVKYSGDLATGIISKNNSPVKRICDIAGTGEPVGAVGTVSSD